MTRLPGTMENSTFKPDQIQLKSEKGKTVLTVVLLLFVVNYDISCYVTFKPYNVSILCYCVWMWKMM